MLLGDSAVALSREELAQTLGVPQAIIDAFVKDTSARISLREVERFLQSALLRVYHAQVESERIKDEITIDLPEPKPLAVVPKPESDEPEIVRSLAEFEALVPTPAEHRVAPRYKPRRQTGGMFGDAKFVVLQMSETGLRIRHNETLLPGQEARMSIALVRPQQSVIVTGRVVWTSIAQRGDGPTYCISGVQVIENEGRLQRMVAMLRDAGELEPERPPGTKGRDDTPSALRGMSDEEIADILRVVRRFTDDPIEASRWYARARFATSDESVRRALQPHQRDREQVLAVWEFLERRIELKKVAGVVSWMRNTRAAAV